MSTKIYEAYRTKKRGADLFALTRIIRQKGIESTVDHLETFMLKLASAVDINGPEALARKSEIKIELQTDAFIRSWVAAKIMDKKYREQVSEPYRNPFAFDTSVAIHELDGHYYFLPYADMNMAGTFDFLKTLPGLEEYHYWNNTDEPEDITRQAWKNRGKNWDKIHDRGWQNHLVLDVMNKNVWYIFNLTWYIEPDGRLDKKHIIGMAR